MRVPLLELAVMAVLGREWLAQPDKAGLRRSATLAPVVLEPRVASRRVAPEAWVRRWVEWAEQGARVALRNRP